mmetsp:Transcript_40127/g.52830  ORF Transcript_40127/g.52830 Transcript_40127/m.52830 type:complete len:82 (+) Transcript_40127:734-979(+)
MFAWKMTLHSSLVEGAELRCIVAENVKRNIGNSLIKMSANKEMNATLHCFLWNANQNSKKYDCETGGKSLVMSMHRCCKLS